MNWWGLGSHYSENPAIGWQFFTFIVFLWIMYRTIRGPLLVYIEARSKEIFQSIEASKEARANSLNKLHLSEARLLSIESEAKKIVDEFAIQGAKEQEEAAKFAQELVARVRRDASDAVDAQLRRARAEIQNELVNRAIYLASKELTPQVLEEVEIGLQKTFCAELESLPR